MWFSLNSAYASPSQSSILTLQRELHKLEQHDDSILNYLARAKKIADPLAAIGHPINHTQFIISIISGLRPEFSDLVTNITARTSPISFEQLHSLLKEHEFVHAKNKGETPFVFLTTGNLAVQQPYLGHFASGSRNNGVNTSSGTQGSQQALRILGQSAASLGYSLVPTQQLVAHGPAPQAFYGTSHNRNNFRGNQGQNHHNNRGYRNRNYNGNGNGGGSRGRGRGGNQNFGCSICGASHLALYCPHRASILGSPSAHLTHTRPESSAQSMASWHPDTGATNHVTPDIAGLDYSEAYHGPDSLHIGSGHLSGSSYGPQ